MYHPFCRLVFAGLSNECSLVLFLAGYNFHFGFVPTGLQGWGGGGVDTKVVRGGVGVARGEERGGGGQGVRGGVGRRAGECHRCMTERVEGCPRRGARARCVRLSFIHCNLNSHMLRISS
jgi:hypothetical protein